MEEYVDEKISFAKLPEDVRKKIHLLLIEADSRLRLSSRHNCEARDLLGQVSHLINGVDSKDFCATDGPSPVDAWKKQRCCR